MFKNIYFKSFVQWILVSSENPTKVSLMIKGILVSAIPTILWATNTFHVLQYLAPESIAAIIDYIVTVISNGLTAVGLILTAWGAIRKIINTFYIPTPPGSDVVYPDPTIPPTTV